MTRPGAAPPPPLVCVGASWGGVVAVRRLLRPLPRDLRAPVCVVQHRGEDSGGIDVAASLARAISLPVQEPEDKQPLEPGAVYLAPPGYHMLVEDGHVSLSLEGRVRWARPSIDVLFESAAAARGSSVVAVVLTGANDDGAAGARAVHEAGGIVLVQDPETAERREMPEATIATGTATEVLPLEQLAGAVMTRLGGG